MRLDKETSIQLAVFAGIAVLVALASRWFSYMQIPTVFLGVGRYTVTVQLPQAANLYQGGNVTYHGVEIGRVAGHQADRYRRRSSASAEVGYRYSRRGSRPPRCTACRQSANSTSN